jgi:CubicO group peptidase (beta-lactamase class C family)
VSLAVLYEGEISGFTSGVADASKGAPVTSETVFRLGSVTKVYTATLVLQLVDEGLVDLDAPVARYVPELVLARPELGDRVTIRALLSHSTGLDLGDVFGPFGSDDDCVARYVEGVGPVDFVHEPGEMFSYTNGGYITLGRVIEAATETTWDDALRSKLLEPLGLNDTTLVLEEDVVHGTGSERLARGHDASSDPVVLSPMADIWGRSTAPAGSTLCATATDVVRFGEFHISETDDSALTRDLRAEMQRQAFANPTYAAYGHGLGWGMHEAGGSKCIAHGGGHYGQAAYLLAVPERSFAVAALTNSAVGARLHSRITSRLLHRYLGVTTSAAYREDEENAPDDLGPLAGVYARRSSVGQESPIQFTLEVDDRGLRFAERDEALERVTPTTFKSSDAVFRFMRFAGDGRPRYAHVGNRAFQHSP